VSQPFFQGGTLWFQRKAAIEATQASLEDYKQVVVTAFQQVADTLRALEHDAELLKAQSQALSSAQEALDLVQANYAGGMVNYLQVIIANNQYQQAKLGYIQAQALRLQDTAALFVALGGGWWNGPATMVGADPSRGVKSGVLAGGR
jgi:outer membrane protein TolC